MQYDLFEHRHRFAVWAAARAAQRGLTSVDVFRDTMQATDLREFVRNPASLRTSESAFEIHHRRWCAAILKSLRRKGIAKATYGRAAKFVAIYLKSMIVIGPHADTRLSSVVHPPIDRVFLKNLGTSDVGSDQVSKWRTTAWTSLDKRSYYALIRDLRSTLREGEPFWKLERYWTFTSSPDSQ